MSQLIVCWAVLAGIALAQPLADLHQHLFSPAANKLAGRTENVEARDLIKLLDEAGIRRAVVLSLAYQYGNPNRPPVEDEHAKVKAENDWTAEQAARYPDRLIAFCAVNPLKDYALDEIARCAKDARLRAGLKLHFGNSDVQLDVPEHVEQVRRVFRAANDRKMAIVVHMRASVTRKRPYGAQHARAFLEQLLPAAPDVTVQIAHLTGAGGWEDPGAEEALGIFVDAIARRDQRMKRVYFDVSGIAGLGKWEERAERIAERIRQVGVKRVVYGSDGVGAGNATPKQAWEAFRKLPLTDAEFRAIEKNVLYFGK